MKVEYFGILDGKEGAYSIVIPDFPGCRVSGDTFDAAVQAASTAISRSARRRLITGNSIPAARSLDSILADYQQITGQRRCGGVAIPLQLDGSEEEPASHRAH